MNRRLSMKKKLKYIMSGVLIGALLFGGIGYAAGTQITVNFLPLKYFFDGVEKRPPGDQNGFVYQGTTYVPLRFVSDSFDKKVAWEGSTYSIYLGEAPAGKVTYLNKLTPHTQDGYSAKHGQRINPFGDAEEYRETNMEEKFFHSFKIDATGYREYILDGQYKSFEAFLGPLINHKGQSKKENIGSITIYGDDVELYKSGPIPSDLIEPIKVKVDLKGVLKMKIEVKDADSLGLLDARLID
jgi:hypothetical protein